MCINVENIQDAIDIIKMPESKLHMSRWQQYADVARPTLDSLHKCGMAACLGGHVAVSPKFIKAGGCARYSGSPEYKELRGHLAIAEWFWISDYLAKDICGLSYHAGGGGVYRESLGVSITKEMVIGVLEKIIIGEPNEL